MGMPGTLLGMLVPPEAVVPEEVLLELGELGMDPLWPEELEGEEGVEEEGDDGELLGDDGELLGDEGELLGEGMLGDGRLDGGVLGGGLLLLEEQPAAPSMAARHSMETRRAAPWPMTIRFLCKCFTPSLPAAGSLRRSFPRDHAAGPMAAPQRESDR
jgi:hypothetical protein